MTWIPGLPGSLEGVTLSATIGVSVTLLIAAVIVVLMVIRDPQRY